MGQYDAVVVGTGFTGAVFARELADSGRNVLVLERRGHIAGNMYDETENGILVQRYGPHSLHTNDTGVYDYLCRFAKLEPYHLTYQAVIGGKAIPFPLDFHALERFYAPGEAQDLEERLRMAFPGRDKAPVFELLSCADKQVRAYAEMLFEEDFRPYTAKQWGKAPHEIDRSVIGRIPIWLGYRHSMFDARYECLPRGGFTRLIEAMLADPRITVQTGVDALTLLRLDESAGLARVEGAGTVPVVYTGAADALFGWELGPLPYRSLYFEWEFPPQPGYQQAAIVAYPKAADYTRITEYTKLPVQRAPAGTAIAREYPLSYDRQAARGNEPYYPIPTPENAALFRRYRERARRYANLILCGRLADYQYYDMDQAIRHALDLFRQHFNEGKRTP